MMDGAFLPEHVVKKLDLPVSGNGPHPTIVVLLNSSEHLHIIRTPRHTIGVLRSDGTFREVFRIVVGYDMNTLIAWCLVAFWLGLGLGVWWVLSKTGMGG